MEGIVHAVLVMGEKGDRKASSKTKAAGLWELLPEEILSAGRGGTCQ